MGSLIALTTQLQTLRKLLLQIKILQFESLKTRIKKNVNTSFWHLYRILISLLPHKCFHKVVDYLKKNKKRRKNTIAIKPLLATMKLWQCQFFILKIFIRIRWSKRKENRTKWMGKRHKAGNTNRPAWQ